MRRKNRGILISAFIFALFGIVLIVVGAVAGGKFSGFGNYDYIQVNETYGEELNHIDLELYAGILSVKQGDSFKVEANVPEDLYEFYTKNQTLYVKPKATKWLFRFWGWNGFHEEDDCSITVYVPENTTLDSIKVKVSAGKVTVNEVTAENADFDLNAGNLLLQSVTVNDSMDVNVNAGKLEALSVVSHGSNIKMNAGRAELSGTFLGTNKIKMNAGSLELITSEKENAYDYQLDINAGKIKINNQSYHNGETNLDNDATNEFDLKCNAGSIILKTE